MKTDGKLNKTSSRLISWFTLKRAWLIYAIALVAYVASVLLSHNALLISLGTTTMTIFVLFLIMMQSNKEVRLGLEKEAKTFEENLKLVTSELKKVSEATLKSVEALSRVEQGVLKVADETDQLKKAEEGVESERVLLLKPKILLSLFSGDYYSFWKHYYLSVSNLGGDARDLQLSYVLGKNTQIFKDQLLQRKRQSKFDCGDISVFRSGSVVHIELSTNDSEGRTYLGIVNIVAGDTNWSEIILSQV
jgi:hypothetical protein